MNDLIHKISMTYIAGNKKTDKCANTIGSTKKYSYDTTITKIERGNKDDKSYWNREES